MQILNVAWFCAKTEFFTKFFAITVMKEKFQVRVESTASSLGNDVALKCVIPKSLQDFVVVTSWVKDSVLNIFPHSSPGE